jgi:hypothetical protein
MWLTPSKTPRKNTKWKSDTVRRDSPTNHTHTE